MKKTRSLFPILLTFFLDNFGLAIIYPIFTPLLLNPEQTIVASTTPLFQRTFILGMLIAAFPLAQFFGAPLIGQFSDRIGRKKAFYITITGAALGYTFTAVSITAQSLVGLFISRFATGAFAGNATLCLAAIADMSPGEVSRTKNFGIVSAVGGLSFIIAIAFAGVFSNPEISRHFNPSFPIWITAILTYINLVSVIFLFHETHECQAHPGINPFKGFFHLIQVIQNKELRNIYIVNFLFILAWVASTQFLPTILIERFQFSLSQITFAFIANGMLWSLSNLFLNRFFAKRYFAGKTLLISLLVLSFLLLFVAISTSAVYFLTLYFACMVCAALCWTNGVATVSLNAPLSIQGAILGINQSMTCIAAACGPIIGGLLVSKSIHAIPLFSSLVCLLATGIAFGKKVYRH